MGKLAQSTSKYIIYINFNADGTVEKPDVIGAVFGQTEGLLGQDMDLRELQKTGRIGRIDVDLKSVGGKTSGVITIPSSLDSSETALIAACMETIERIGPCNTRLKVDKVDDVRITKRQYVVERAKELLGGIFEQGLPETQELSEQIKEAVRTSEVAEYKGLPAGPNIESYDSLIIVEGRADVIKLLKNGIKNVIAVEGTSVPKQMAEIAKTKEITAFLDGDRGGDLILKELSSVCEVDFVARAPEGKEVEDLTKKEIFKALREREPFGKRSEKKASPEKAYETRDEPEEEEAPQYRRRVSIDRNMAEKFKEVLSQLTGTKAAYYFTEDMEIYNTIRESEASVLALDGVIDQKLIDLCARNGIKYLVAMKSTRSRIPRNIIVVTLEDLE